LNNSFSALLSSAFSKYTFLLFLFSFLWMCEITFFLFYSPLRSSRIDYWALLSYCEVNDAKLKMHFHVVIIIRQHDDDDVF
jgi:hypothetical protein